VARSEPSTDDPDEDTFAALTLKERIAVATAQDPSKAIVVILLGLFALTFLVALSLVFPVVAGLFVLGTLLVVVLAVGGYVVLTRLDG
jgi:Flp pilus assembly protein TadB